MTQPHPPTQSPHIGQPQQPPATPYTENPGQTMGIIGLVLNAIGINLGGIILGVLSRNKSKEANMPTTLGTVSLVWGIIATVLTALFAVFWVIMVVIMIAQSDQYTTPAPSPSTPIDSYAQ